MTTERFFALKAQADEVQAQVKPKLRQLAEARRRYAETHGDDDWARLEAVQAEASGLQEAFHSIVAAMEKASGIPPEVIDSIEESERKEGSGLQDLARGSLTEDRVVSTTDVDEHLPASLEAIERVLPVGWIQHEDPDLCRLSTLPEDDGFLALTRNLRRESEFPVAHRFRQALRVAYDYRDRHPRYDHFAGASLVPLITHLGLRLSTLQRVGGDVSGRLQHLWRGHSDDVDGTLMEILLAARCAELGREVEFIAETNSKSPDLRCYDPFPVVIECKRQRALSDYEVAEEAVMRDLFLRLSREASRRGLFGYFGLNLDVEASVLDRDEVVARLISQRLAPHPERELIYPWGRTSLHERPARLDFPGTTRPYSPNMLEYTFGWHSDLPEWDGLCCSISNAREALIDHARSPLGLIWTNTSKAATRKRTWAPINLFGQAFKQVPPGEHGIVYVAYIEGAREEMADARLQAFSDRIKEWVHAASIRVPIAFLCRLYPRPLGDGQPDLIESSVCLCNGAYGEPALFDNFPAAIFTVPA